MITCHCLYFPLRPWLKMGIHLTLSLQRSHHIQLPLRVDCLVFSHLREPHVFLLLFFNSLWFLYSSIIYCDPYGFFSWIFQMDHHPFWYISFVDSMSNFTQHLAFIAWSIYTPSHSLLHVSGVCVGSDTNNKVEYDVVLGFLTDALHLCIHHLYVHLDSQLLNAQFNNYYQVHHPYLFRRYLWVQQLAKQFESITFIFVPRSLNKLIYTTTHHIWDSHFIHTWYRKSNHACTYNLYNTSIIVNKTHYHTHHIGS